MTTIAEETSNKLEDMDTEVTGDLERVLFRNENTGYAGLLLDNDGTTIAAVGQTPLDIPIGTSLCLTGKWGTHKKYGEQFQFKTYKIVVPDTAIGMKKYLASGLIKGIGPVMAEKIVDKFGADTIKILDSAPERLKEIPGLGDKKMGTIKDAWQAHRYVHDIMIFLQGLGISAAYATRIYKQFGKDTIAHVKFNPFSLTDIWGIGFDTADRIARSVGIPADNEVRIKSGILYTLTKAAAEGHCYFPKDVLTERAAKILALSEIPTQEDTDRLRLLIPLVLPSLEQEKRIVIEDDLRVFLPQYHQAEIDVATRIKELNAVSPHLPGINLDKAIPRTEKKLNIAFAHEQRMAIRNVFESSVTVVTGGPGTGKSTLLKGLLDILKSKDGVEVGLAAPTGRAAKRMEEITGEPAKTIHRLLEYDPNSGDFTRNEDHQLDYNVIVVDEVSMLDITLCDSLLKAIHQGTSVLLIGDIDQLPSVGSGNVLKDIIESRLVTVTRLTHIFRQGEGSLISINAQLVKRGSPLEFRENYKGEKDFFFIERSTPEKIMETVVKVIKERAKEAFNLDYSDVQVLSMMHKGTVGCGNLNAILQEQLNPRRGLAEIEKGPRIYRVNDSVIQMRNDYERVVFNGDTGVITHIDPDEKTVIVNYYGRAVEYDYNELDSIQLAYAITVHKAQGSEYKCVIIPVHTCFYVMLNRSILYTAISRGKQVVILIGTREALDMCIRNNKSTRRYTTLTDKIIKASQKVEEKAISSNVRPSTAAYGTLADASAKFQKVTRLVKKLGMGKNISPAVQNTAKNEVLNVR